eukprot:Seg15024.1 transcript_id=Seg15024.1/GoldUCD/mRNA.D3Y31 product="hypothetical protein" protein_id=Seg15024.1/GoldUCD/D3Y31
MLSHEVLQTKAKKDDEDSFKSDTNPSSLTFKKLANDFARRKSVFAFDNIGKNAVDVESMLKNRKESEDNPSSKFLTMSFQNSEGDTNEGETIQDGVMYARTVKQKEGGQLGNRTTKTLQPEQEQEEVEIEEEIENVKKSKSGKIKKDKKKKSKRDKGKVVDDKGKNSTK